MDVDLRDRWLALATRRLTDAGLRAGAARTAVIELLARDGQCLLSVPDVVDQLRARGAGGSAATVYRVVDELSDLGLLHRLHGPDGVSRYEIAVPDEHHHHFIDDATGEVRPFSDPDLESALDAVAHRLGVRLTGHDIVLRGIREAAGKNGSHS